MVKSLISSHGLQSSWQKVRKRLVSVEGGLSKVQSAIDSRTFVFRDEFSDVVEKRHAGQLSRHAEEMAALADAQAKLSTAMYEEQLPSVQRCVDQVRSMQDAIDALTHEVAALRSSSREQQEMVDGGFKRLDENILKAGADMDARTASLEEMMRAQGQASDQKLSELEETMQLSITEINNQIASLAADDEGGDLDGEGDELDWERAGQDDRPSGEFVAAERSGSKLGRLSLGQMSGTTSIGERAGAAGGKGALQKKVVDMVEKMLVQPLWNELGHTLSRLSAVEEGMGKQAVELKRQIRVVEKSLDNFKNSTRNTTDQIREDLDTCFKRDEASKLETALSGSIGELWGDFDGLRQTAVGKLNQFVDHFAKIHESINDHEHCLRHHAEEIENRCTKYDILACQRQIDTSVLKDDFVRETSELRQLLEWQEGKIEAFGLISGSGASRGKPAAAGRERAPRDSPRNGPGSAGRSPGNLGHGEGDAGVAIGRNQTLLTEQLNALAMGVVWLAHLVLQEPKLGGSRSQRLASERDILEELKSVRHWITHKTSPQGWDTCRLTTATLEHTHPHEAMPPVSQPPPMVRGASQAMAPVKEQQVMSARQVRRPAERQRSPPGSARLTKASWGSANTASLSTFASEGDIHSAKASTDRLPKLGGSAELGGALSGAGGPKVQPPRSADSLPLVARV